MPGTKRPAVGGSLLFEFVHPLLEHRSLQGIEFLRRAVELRPQFPNRFLTLFVDFEFVRLLETDAATPSRPSVPVRLDRTRILLQTHVGLPELIVRDVKSGSFLNRRGEGLGGLVEAFGRHELLPGSIELDRLTTALLVGNLLCAPAAERSEHGDRRFRERHVSDALNTSQKKGGHRSGPQSYPFGC